MPKTRKQIAKEWNIKQIAACNKPYDSHNNNKLAEFDDSDYSNELFYSEREVLTMIH